VPHGWEIGPWSYAQQDPAVQAALAAAQKGDAEAQFRLGEAYDLGKGVPQDYRQAVQWYRRAADQGDARAQVLPGNLYQLGQGVPKSAVVAYALYIVAIIRDASKGNPAPQHRSQIAHRMSGAELAATKDLSAAMSKPCNFAQALEQYLSETAKP
jgi:TPR repeat protein